MPQLTPDQALATLREKADEYSEKAQELEQEIANGGHPTRIEAVRQRKKLLESYAESHRLAAEHLEAGTSPAKIHEWYGGELDVNLT